MENFSAIRRKKFLKESYQIYTKSSKCLWTEFLKCSIFKRILWFIKEERPGNRYDSK